MACITIVTVAEILSDHVDPGRPVFSFAAVSLLGTALGEQDLSAPIEPDDGILR